MCFTWNTYTSVCIIIMHKILHLLTHQLNQCFYLQYNLMQLYILCTLILEKTQCWYTFLRHRGMTKPKMYWCMLVNVHRKTWIFEYFKNVVTTFPVGKFMLHLLLLMTHCGLILQHTSVSMLFKEIIRMLSFIVTMFFAIVSPVR